MKVLIKWTLYLAVLGLICTGCASSQNNGDSPNDSPQTEDIGQSNQDTDDNTGENSKDSNKKQENNVIRILEQNIQYKLNGELKEETAFLKYSDNQHFSMYVLPGFTLTAEEPNKDSLFLTENDHIFMRIELLPADTDWELLEESTKAQLESVNESIQLLQAPSDEFFKNTIVMEAIKENDVVTSYLVKNKELPIKLTVFTTKDADYKDPFLQMSKTIMKEIINKN